MVLSLINAINYLAETQKGIRKFCDIEKVINIYENHSYEVMWNRLRVKSSGFLKCHSFFLSKLILHLCFFAKVHIVWNLYFIYNDIKLIFMKTDTLKNHYNFFNKSVLYNRNEDTWWYQKQSFINLSHDITCLHRLYVCIRYITNNFCIRLRGRLYDTWNKY